MGTYKMPPLNLSKNQPPIKRAGVPSFTLSSGDDMPKVGFGCWKIEKKDCAEAVYNAIKNGYRCIDEAHVYLNEVQAGEGIKRAIDEGIVTRKDLFITSKLWCNYHSKKDVKMALKNTLKDLGLDYLDLYLIHFPVSIPYRPISENISFCKDPSVAKPMVEISPVPMHEVWSTLEGLVAEGLTRNIGLSNYSCQLIGDLLKYCRIKPAVLQVELHPYLTQQGLVDFCLHNGIAVTAYSSFGASSYVSMGVAKESESVLEDPVVTAIGSEYGKTGAQIVLKWAVQRGTAVIPKSMNAVRIKENFDLFDFELTDAQMTEINGLNKARRFNDPNNYVTNDTLIIFDE